MRLCRTILVASSLLPALHAPAQSDVTTLKVYSRETIVDVSVTDSNGNPVYGLTQDDFTVAENGKPQPIRSFAEFGAETPTPRALPRLPPGVYTNYQPIPSVGPLNILLIDALNANRTGVFYAQQGILAYLGKMPEGTQAAIFWMSDSGLHLLQGFTTDRAALVKAVSAPRLDVGSIVTGWVRQKFTTDSLIQLAQYAAGFKSRKNLLWFTPGMPALIMRDGGYAWMLPPDMTMVHRNMDAYEMLTAAQVAIYPIDSRGPEVRMGKSTLEVEQVAEDTGGAAFYNNNDIGSLVAKAVEHGTHYYTLSYIPPKLTDDGHYHHIAVQVNRPGLHLVYRKGYNAEPLPVKDVAPGPQFMKAAMEGNAPPATQLLFDAMVEPVLVVDPTTHPIATSNPAAKGKRPASAPSTLRYNIVYLLPQSQLSFADGPDSSHDGSLEFDAAAYDNKRARVALISQTVKMPLTAERYEQFIQKPFRFSQQLDLPLGQLTLRVGVLDRTSHNVGTIEIPITVGAEQPDTLHANTPPCPPRCALPQPEPSSAPR